MNTFLAAGAAFSRKQNFCLPCKSQSSAALDNSDASFSPRPGKSCATSAGAQNFFLRALTLLWGHPHPETSSLEGLPSTGHHPLIKAALLYHLSRLLLSDPPLKASKLPTPLAMLTQAYELSTSAPLLLRKVALQLAVMYSTPLGDGVKLDSHVSPDPKLAAHYHQAAVGASAVQQQLTIVDTKLAALSRTSESEVSF